MVRVSPRQLLLGVLALSAVIFLRYCSQDQSWLTWRSPFADPPPRTHTLILSSWRSGSSFLGQVFNQHPEVFYLMEPMKHVWSAMPTLGEASLRGVVRDVLRSLCDCNESALVAYMHPDAQHLASLFMFDASAALCRPPACTTTAVFNASDLVKCVQACAYAPLEGLGLACETSRHVVVKSVRLLGLRVLRPLATDPAVRLRIIHLVRDPRAVLASRRSLSPFYLQADNRVVLGRDDLLHPSLDIEVMGKICRGIDNIAAEVAEDGRRGKSRDGARGDLSRAYMAVRYEDLVRSPELTVRRMFRFAGIDLPGVVMNWVELMTRGGKESGAGFNVMRMEARVVARRWRDSLAWTDVRAVQDACRAAMARFRYREFESVDQLLNESVDAFY